MSPTDRSPSDAPLLCVSIHDVAPATWADCVRLRDAIRAVAGIPLTWLVVPRFHGSEESSPAMEAQLGAALARGDELALHGYTHLDLEPAQGGLGSRFLRGVYTQREGEFAALAEGAARRRIELGLAWFAERGWRPSGFVAPAWLLGEGAWRALRAFPFAYTTTFSRFHLLPNGPSLFSPSLVYTARNRAGRTLSPLAAGATAALLAGSPLVRLSLHPRDAHHPALLRHAQGLLERLLATRVAVTKAECARRLTSAAPTSLHHASRVSPHSRSSTDSCRSVPYLPCC
jgi:predicted deacetylase